MSNFKKEDIEKGIQNLVKVINRQKEEITELKSKLAEYESQDVCESWENMRVSQAEALTVVAILARHAQTARENYGNGN